MTDTPKIPTVKSTATDRLLTFREVNDLLGSDCKTAHTVLEYARRGLLKQVRLSTRAYRYTESSVRALIAARMAVGDADTSGANDKKPKAVVNKTKASDCTVDGMTLRDWFAGQALAGINASSGGSGYPTKHDDAAEYAECAYLQADAMLAERAIGRGRREFSTQQKAPAR
jgi:predicted DNA-binding transcriptional regulator AlpA